MYNWNFITACNAFYCTSLYCASQTLFFTDWRFVPTRHPASTSAPFFQQHLLIPCLSLCHIWQLSWYFKCFHYYIGYGDLWAVVFDVTMVIVSGLHEMHLYKMNNLTDKCCVCSDYSTDQLFPHLSPSPWPSVFPGIQQYWN